MNWTQKLLLQYLGIIAISVLVMPWIFGLVDIYFSFVRHVLN